MGVTTPRPDTQTLLASAAEARAGYTFPNAHTRDTAGVFRHVPGEGVLTPRVPWMGGGAVELCRVYHIETPFTLQVTVFWEVNAEGIFQVYAGVAMEPQDATILVHARRLRQWAAVMNYAAEVTRTFGKHLNDQGLRVLDGRLP